MADIFPSILPDDDEREAFEPTTDIERAGQQGELVGYEELLEAGECPWCDYDGGHPKQHAPKAHPDAWSEYKED